MTIFFVNTASGWGGGEKWHLETALAMQAKNYRVVVMARPEHELFRKASSLGLKTIPVHVTNLSFLNPFKIYAVKCLLKKEVPDVVILNFSADLKTIGIAARYAGIKNIIYRRGNAKAIRNSLFNRFLFRNIVTGMIANSEETKRSVRIHNPKLFPEEKIKVIYNGISLSKFDQMPSEPLYSREEQKIILGSAGRLSHEKGHHFLIEIAVLLKKEQIPFTILMAGEGPRASDLKKAVAENQLQNHVVFTGFVQNMKAFMESIDIFILPSLWEGFGYVSIEAMACRKPVVCFRVGSNPEVVAHNETGFLAKPFDINEITGYIKRLMDDISLRNALGTSGRQRVERVFESSSIEKELTDYLTSLKEINK